MRKLILSMMVSLDGFVEDADQKIEWHHWNSEMDQYMEQFFEQIDLIILGRVSYQMMADFWPTPLGEAESTSIAERMNNLPKLIFSRELTEAPWGKYDNVSIVSGQINEKIVELKTQPGKDIVIFGGANLASSLMDLDLIDAFQIFINPVVLGGGTPLFKNTNKSVSFKLEESKTFTSGNVLIKYYK